MGGHINVQLLVYSYCMYIQLFCQIGFISKNSLMPKVFCCIVYSFQHLTCLGSGLESLEKKSTEIQKSVLWGQFKGTKSGDRRARQGASRLSQNKFCIQWCTRVLFSHITFYAPLQQTFGSSQDFYGKKENENNLSCLHLGVPWALLWVSCQYLPWLVCILAVAVQ